MPNQDTILIAVCQGCRTYVQELEYVGRSCITGYCFVDGDVIAKRPRKMVKRRVRYCKDCKAEADRESSMADVDYVIWKDSVHRCTTELGTA